MAQINVKGQLTRAGKIVCIGRNYVAHIHELGNEVPDDMVVFMKPASAISDNLYSERGGEPLHYEAELAFTLHAGQLAAVGFGLDLTKRALQSQLKAKGLPWERAKAFDGAALFSDFVALPPDIAQLSLQLKVDGEIRQQGGVSHMLYPPQTILSELAGFITLEDGDIIMTGTPAGVGTVQPGQHFEGSVICNGEQLLGASWIAE